MSHLERFKAILDEAGRHYEEYAFSEDTTAIELSQPLSCPKVKVLFDEEGRFDDIVPYAR